MEKDVLHKARELFAAGEIEKSLELVKSFWLENPDDAEAATLLSDLMRESGRSELSKRLSTLSEYLPLDIPAPSSEDVRLKQDNNAAPNLSGGKELFEAGHGLIDARQHELAAMLLSRVARIAPEEPTVNYELGFALMSMKRFQEAIPHLEQALNGDADFDTLLNLLVCYTLTRQLDKAKDTLQKISQLELDPDQKHEYQHRQLIIKRLEGLNGKTKLSSRDWLYVLYGSILLRPSLHHERIKEDPISIGLMLALLKGVLEGLAAPLEAVEFYGPQSRPLAQALSEFLEIPMTGYKGPAREQQTLLVMTWASDIIGPHKSFVPKEKTRSLFSYALTWDEPLPVVPEIVGCLTDDDPMPWHEQKSALTTQNDNDPIGQSRYSAEIEKTYKAILADARDLESDPRTIKNVQSALDYYESKRQHLVLCNPRVFTNRCEYTAEIID